MPSTLNAVLLCAVMLAALLQCAPGAPVLDAPTDSPAGDPSGEEEEEEERPSDQLSAYSTWDSAIRTAGLHQNEFEREFQKGVKYHILKDYTISSLPAGCPYSNISMEACLHRLVQGLLVYTVLLKHVETENPSSSIASEARHHGGVLIRGMKEKMRNKEQVTAMTSSQEEQLLRDLDNPDTFHRKMTAYSILRQLQDFLIDGKRAIKKREKARASIRLWHPSASTAKS